MISIIVPVYNAERYIDKCINSLIDQTYGDIEMILVDDGSTDNSGAMCDAWLQMDARISVIHKPNGGLSSARNAGLDAAAGEYISFIDSDDYVARDMLESMLNVMKKEGCDVVECAYLKVGENEAAPQALNGGDYTVMGTERALEELMYERLLHQVVWNKLYSRKAMGELRFNEGKLHEDEFFTYRALGNSLRVASINRVLYYYVQHENSIMSSAYSTERLDVIEALEQRLRYIEGSYPALAPLARSTYLCACMYHYQYLCRSRGVDADGKCKAEIINRVKNEKGIDAAYAQMQGKTAFFFKLFRRFPYLTAQIRNALKVGL